ncbi:hypothetical protein [Amycolatopsis rhizosphaerae]|uniref:hypothetical protein n=1 Tax=Amycolatopsis rhizosphaerae TaxID=2053003 RepID=UPI0016438F37|nr:hypothetical protein [Amycolatopsis rhizosphaerae]
MSGLLTATATLPVIEAHEGGWDELAVFLGPLAIVAVLVYVARRGKHADQDDHDD